MLLSNMMCFGPFGSFQTVSLHKFTPSRPQWLHRLGHFVLFHPDFFCWPVLNNTARIPSTLTNCSISRRELIPYAYITIDKFPVKLTQKFPICLQSMALFWGSPGLSDGYLRRVSSFMHELAVLILTIKTQDMSYQCILFIAEGNCLCLHIFPLQMLW